MNSDQEFLEHLVKSLVDKPDVVKVERVVDEMGVLLTLDVDPEDMGKIIGRSGNTAKAIRTLLRVVGMKNNARVNLKINEPEGGTGGNRPERTERTERTEQTERPERSEQPQGMDQASYESATKSVDEAMEDLKV